MFFQTTHPDGTRTWPIVRAAPEPAEQVWRSLSYIASRYFHQPNYWRIEGRPVLAVWDTGRLPAALGLDGARVLLADLRAHVKHLGHEGIWLHASEGSWRTPE